MLELKQYYTVLIINLNILSTIYMNSDRKYTELIN